MSPPIPEITRLPLPRTFSPSQIAFSIKRAEQHWDAEDADRFLAKMPTANRILPHAPTTPRCPWWLRVVDRGPKEGQFRGLGAGRRELPDEASGA
jgi:hypothetical protein